MIGQKVGVGRVLSGVREPSAVREPHVVEFRDGLPTPVEYKHGPRRKSRHDELQLAAQALCLEEMFEVGVPRGAIYHHSSRRRREVAIGGSLRSAVAEATEQVRRMIRSGRLPPAVNDARCPNCSLRESCLPTVTEGPTKASRAVRLLFVISDRSVRE